MPSESPHPPSEESSPGPRRRIGVAVIGFGWMGRVHTQAYLRAGHHFPTLPLEPRLVAVADEFAARANRAADRYGFGRSTPDWRSLVDDPGIEAVSITAPNYLHREIAVAFARAGKHIWVEKPVGVTAADAQAVADAATHAGVQTTVGFNYRHAPAVQHARTLIHQAAIGAITNVRIRMLSDYAAHPSGALSWRFERDRGGSGVLGDLASHGVDLARFLVGEIAEVVADTATFIPERPHPSAAGSHYDIVAGGELGPVENEDYVGGLIHFANGARGMLEASRVSVGDQCTYGFEVHGTKGLLAWDFRRLGELQVSLGESYLNQSVTTVFMGPEHGQQAAFQPGAGIALGYDDLKVIEAADFLISIAEGRPRGATIADAVRSAQILDAMERSVDRRTWTATTPS
jgi:predicted dehydrogenase